MKNATLLSITLLLVIAACSPQPSAQEGRVVFAIKDAAASMGAVSSVKVTIDSVRLKAADDTWVTVSSKSQTFDLLELKARGEASLLADATVANGNYTELRLDISKVVVTDANGTYEAKLPSNVLRMKGDIEVTGNKTSTATFDFIADESLHVTGNGKYILAPVIQVQTKDDATVDVSDQSNVQIGGGRTRTNAKVGMDEKGNIDVGLKIPADAAVDIGADGIVKVGGKAMAGTGVGLNTSTKGKVNVTI